eukprot:scaffold55767_cov36-Cyclotella_meneghiniana.AAC.3
MQTTALRFTGRVAGACMHDKCHTWHIHAPTYDISMTNSVMQATTIPIIKTNHNPVDPLSNFVNYPNIQPMIDPFWNQADLYRPPNAHLRSLQIYSAMYGNWGAVALGFGDVVNIDIDH